MDKKTAQRLAKRIEREDSKCQVTGIRHHDSGYYSLAVTDMRNGYPFVVTDIEDWERRQQEAQNA
jgi:hypothetical protein